MSSKAEKISFRKIRVSVAFTPRYIRLGRMASGAAITCMCPMIDDYGVTSYHCNSITAKIATIP